MSDFGLRPSTLLKLLGTADCPRIFDVRRAPDFLGAKRVVPAARWRAHTTSGDDWSRLAPAGQSIVVYCAHGGRCSQLAAATLRDKGFDARYLEGGFEAWVENGGPTIVKAALPGRDEQQPSVWVTRVRPKIDRIACPWLIRRFIDPEARFLFVEPPEVAAVAGEMAAIPYDIEGVAFGHDGELCTFDTLLSAFRLSERSLDALAVIVRGADTARLDLAPEAAGLLAVSLGNSSIAGGDDHRALALGFPVYDALIAWLRNARSETHNWPRPAA